MMYWLIRYEAFPQYFASGKPVGYRQLLANGPILADSWMKVSVQGIHVGYSHTRIDLNEESASERYIIQNRTAMSLNLLGRMEQVSVNATALLDALYNLQRFDFSLRAMKYRMRVQARRAGENTFIVKVKSPAGEQQTRMDLPPDIVLYNPMLEMSLGELKPGEKMSIRTLDPVSLTPIDIVVRAERRDELIWEGHTVPVTVVTYEYSGMKVTSWINASGTMLRQETPMGWVLEACDANEAMDVDESAAADLDLLRSFAIPVAMEEREIEDCPTITYRIEGPGIEQMHLNSHRQTVLENLPNSIVVECRAETPPTPSENMTLSPEEVSRYLKPTLYIQSDDPGIQKMADRITRKHTDPWQKAQAIYQWVYKNVRKNPTASLPSAVDVLDVLEGDCNEHTYLFVALARAAGLPSRVQVGLLLLDGALYYHAWPAVYVGRWVEMDPTTGEKTVNALHISLLEGELTEQMKLLPIAGQASAQVVAVDCTRAGEISNGDNK